MRPEYAKSVKGLWVKAEHLDDEGVIRVFWHVRHAVVEGHVIRYDANGDVISREPVAFASFGGWELCGSIVVDDGFAVAADLADAGLDCIIGGVLRHVVKLVVLGWGDDPGECVGWFRDLPLWEWVVDGAYLLTDRGMFCGLGGSHVVIDGDVAEVVVAGADRIQLDLSGELRASLLAYGVPV